MSRRSAKPMPIGAQRLLVAGAAAGFVGFVLSALDGPGGIFLGSAVVFLAVGFLWNALVPPAPDDTDVDR